MRIALVCNEYPPAPHGGIGTFVHTFAHGLAEAGHSVRVVGTGDTAGVCIDGPVTVETLASAAVPQLSWLLDRLRLRRRLRTLVRAGQLDVVELPDYQGLLPLRFTACPVAVRLHLSSTSIARHSGQKPKLLDSACERRTLRLYRNWIAVSEYALALTASDFALQPTRSRVIYYPVSIAPPTEAPAELPSEFVLFAGTVTPRKGALTLAEAARHFLIARPQCHLFYAGGTSPVNGVPIERLVAEAVGSSLTERVHFLGRISRPLLSAYMRRASVFAFPSTLETFGLVVAEALLHGCPVITSDQPPFTEFVKHNQTGLLVPPGDVAALAAAVEATLANPLRARELAEAGRREVEQQFSLQNAVSASLHFYRELQSAHARSVSPT